MSHKSKPAPKQSAVSKARKPVTAHAGKRSVGHTVGTRNQKLVKAYSSPTITSPDNGRRSDTTRPVTTRA